MEPTLIITSISALAKVVIDVWKTGHDRHEAALNRESQFKLAQAREQHETALERIRQGQLKAQAAPASDYFVRLREEAAQLSAALKLGIMFESIDAGYGLAIPVSERLIVVFWLPDTFPTLPPKVLYTDSNGVQSIKFEAGTWNPSLSLLDIVIALWAGTD